MLREEPYRALLTIVQQYDVVRDARLCRALLLDLCGECEAEINILMAAHAARVPRELLRQARIVPPVVLWSNLAWRLTVGHAMTDEAARWAVGVWARVLGVPRPDVPRPDVLHIDRATRCRAVVSVSSEPVEPWAPPVQTSPVVTATLGAMAGGLVMAVPTVALVLFGGAGDGAPPVAAPAPTMVSSPEIVIDRIAPTPVPTPLPIVAAPAVQPAGPVVAPTADDGGWHWVIDLPGFQYGQR